MKLEKLTGDIQRNVGSKRNGYSGSFNVHIWGPYLGSE